MQISFFFSENMPNENVFYSDHACALAFEADMKSLRWHTCERCKEKIMAKANGKKRCYHGTNCWQFSEINNMDPGSVPEELSQLTFVEEQVIARSHPLITVFKVKGHQYAYKGNVISFSQDVKELATQLPHKIKDLDSVVCVQFKNNAEKFHDFHIRSGRVKRALVWLKANNPYYKDIIISEENLKSLPDDGNVFDQIQSITLATDDSTDTEESINGNEKESTSEKDNGPEVMQSGVPNMASPLQDDQIKEKLNWPALSKEPIDEYSTPGFIVTAFPTLFPYGNADFRDDRMKEIKPASYFKHLINYYDDRFARHPTFRFFAYNSWMRMTAMSDGKIFVRNNKEFQNMTISKLKEMISENQNVMKQIMFQSSNLRGTKAYWHTRSNELRDMVDQLGLPTIFLTLSCADGHWESSSSFCLIVTHHALQKMKEDN